MLYCALGGNLRWQTESYMELKLFGHHHHHVTNQRKRNSTADLHLVVVVASSVGFVLLIQYNTIHVRE
jgi:extradiol dioxygenase family protein